ncbi:MAG TPA: hypothetical protein VGN80_17285 [Devosiaceae bacterium]|jgi:hypothetical protein|nr:hypothetical protein [Devosiaceae bacterium]
MAKRRELERQADLEDFLLDEAEEEAAAHAEMEAEEHRHASSPSPRPVSAGVMSDVVTRIRDRDRQARWRDRQRAAGMVQLRVWVHADDADELLDLADELRRRRSEREGSNAGSGG